MITIEQGAELLRQVRTSVATRIVGQDTAIEDALVVFLARGHLLIEGVPGTAKTLLRKRFRNCEGSPTR